MPSDQIGCNNAIRSINHLILLLGVRAIISNVPYCCAFTSSADFFSDFMVPFLSAIGL